MSIQLINQYYNKRDRIVQYGGSKNELSIRDPFKGAWKYKLGNRSAIEWILDQYKEKKPKDPTIAEKFNSYRFADHKEGVIELIRKVTTVNMESMEIINRMGNEKE